MSELEYFLSVENIEISLYAQARQSLLLLTQGNIYNRLRFLNKYVLTEIKQATSRKLVKISYCRVSSFLKTLPGCRVSIFITEPLLGRSTLPCLLTNPPRATAPFELESVGNLLLSSVSAFRSLALQTLDKEGRTGLDCPVEWSLLVLPPVLLELEGVSLLVELEDHSALALLKDGSFVRTICAIRSIS